MTYSNNLANPLETIIKNFISYDWMAYVKYLAQKEPGFNTRNRTTSTDDFNIMRATENIPLELYQSVNDVNVESIKSHGLNIPTWVRTSDSEAFDFAEALRFIIYAITLKQRFSRQGVGKVPSVCRENIKWLNTYFDGDARIDSTGLGSMDQKKILLIINKELEELLSTFSNYKPMNVHRVRDACGVIIEALEKTGWSDSNKKVDFMKRLREKLEPAS